MYDVTRVQIMNSKTYVDEYLPDKIVDEWFSSLFLDDRGEIAMLAILHDDINTSPIDD